MRIVSLVPSLSHTIASIEPLAASLVGCTNFCSDPPWLGRSLTRVGGTKDADVSLIADLSPTHILVNREENTKDIVLACHDIAPVFESFPKSPDDVVTMLAELSLFLGQSLLLQQMSRQLASELKVWKDSRSTNAPGSRYLYLIWREPYMAVGEETYISSTLGLLGFRNCLSGRSEWARYPVLAMEQMQALRPDYVFFASEPFPFRKRQIQEFAEKLQDSGPTLLKVDGKILSWHGLLTLELFTNRLRPEMGLDERVEALSC